MPNTPHRSVMLKEVLSFANACHKGVFVDATFGAGGYSRGLLEAGWPQVIAFDQDQSAAKYLTEINGDYPSQVTFINDNFSNLLSHITNEVDGFVFDIGVSSMQIDQAARGFSFNKDGALDMRMNLNGSLTAEYVINQYPEEQLANLIFNYGGERKSRRIARFITERRLISPIKTTLELASIVSKAVGYYKDDIHPATRTFQAIRIEVNNELKSLEDGLKAAAELVKLGGVIIVVTFHSLEDQIVKKYFAEICGTLPNTNRHMPEIMHLNNAARFTNVSKKVVLPTEQEVALNPRARSAKLRAIRRVA